MLYLTSFGFGAVSYVALLKRQKWLGLLFMMLYGTSVLHHANYTKTNYLLGSHVATLDKLLSRLIGITIFYKINTIRFNSRVGLAYALNLMVPYIYYFRLCHTQGPYEPFKVCTQSKWHAVMHVFGVIGPLVLLSELSRQKHV